MNARRYGWAGLVMSAAIGVGSLGAEPEAAGRAWKRDAIGPLAPGDSDAQLVYTPVAPCRLVDTRVAGGSLPVGVPRDLRVTGLDLSAQGGSATGCNVPHGRATSALINFVAVNPVGAGNLRAWAYRTPPAGPPLSSVLNYALVGGSGLNLANALAVPICDPAAPGQDCPLDLRVQADGSGTHLVADVVGFFERFPTEQVAGLALPTGAIIVWDLSDSCPAGYTRAGTFDGRFLRGAVAAPGGTGGESTHIHDITHDHGMGGHDHGAGTTQVSASVGRFGATRFTDEASRTPHAHAFVTGGPSPDVTDGSDPAMSGPAPHLPRYADVLFCRRDVAAAGAAPPAAATADTVPLLQELRKGGGVERLALGDTNVQLAYTPVAPCRILDTRSAGGALAVGTPRDFQVTSTDLSPQGGSATGCAVPFGRATAALINLVAVQATGRGNLRAWAYHTPAIAPPAASVLNYAFIAGSPLNIANGIAIPICDPAVSGQACTFDFRVQADGSGTHLVADVVGFFERFPTEEVAASLVPTGAIVAWKESDECPPSYVRVGAFDGRFLRGASTAGGTGGAETHSHDIPHTHGMNHTHSGTTGPSLSPSAPVGGDGFGCSDPEHTHDFTSGGPSPNRTDGPSATTTASASNLPAYSNVLFCRKIVPGGAAATARGTAKGPALRAEREDRSKRDSVEAQALGDSNAHLVYTPVAPCRLIDTRAAGGALAAGAPRDFQVTGLDLSPQGGSAAGCHVPRGRGTVAFVNLVAVQPTGRGNLRAWAYRTPAPAPPTASALNYASVAGSGLNIANAIPVPICDPAEPGQTCPADFRVEADGSGTHLVADVVGFWERFPMEELAVPAGVLIIWDQSGNCPIGYTRADTLEGRFLRGASTAGETGGADTHAHDIAHSHGMGHHTHGGTTGPSSESPCEGTTVGSHTARARHTHAFTTGGPSVNVTGGANATSSGDASSLPPYADVLFCRKS